MSNQNKTAKRHHDMLIERVLLDRQSLTDWLLSDDFDLDAIRKGHPRACKELSASIQELRDLAELRDAAFLAVDSTSRSMACINDLLASKLHPQPDAAAL